jgi:hypothetical protein
MIPQALGRLFKWLPFKDQGSLKAPGHGLKKPSVFSSTPGEHIAQEKRRVDGRRMTDRLSLQFFFIKRKISATGNTAGVFRCLREQGHRISGKAADLGPAELGRSGVAGAAD